MSKTPFTRTLAGIASKLLSLAVVLVVMYSPLLQVVITPIAHAAKCVSTALSTAEKQDPANWRDARPDGSCPQLWGMGYELVPSTLAAEDKKIVEDLRAKAAATDSLGCGTGGSKFDGAVCVTNVIYAFTVGLGGGLAYVAGFMFDITVALSLNSTAYALSFLSSGWTAARDLANMAFVLILVYIAYTIMLRVETANTIRMLVGVVFIALIINFSFFFTRVVIDAGNILGVQIYNSITGPTLRQTIDQTSASTLASAAQSGINTIASKGVLENTKDLTASIMNALNIQQLFNDQNFKSFASQNGFGTKFIILTFLYFAIGACYFILAAMFFAAAVKFLMRIVILWFLIIASPLAFVAKAIPNDNVKEWYDSWQRLLVDNAFYPAFFLFIFFFISVIVTSLGSDTGILGGLAVDLRALGSNNNLDGFTFIATSIASVAIRLGFVVGLLYIGLKASERMGKAGAKAAGKVSAFAFGSAGRLVSAPVGWAGRRTFGAVGGGMANLSTRAGNRALLANNIFSKAAWKGASTLTGKPGNALGKASYDPRNAPGASVLKKAAEAVTGSSINAGKPPEGGYLGTIAAKKKERDDRIKNERAARNLLMRDREIQGNVKRLGEKSARLAELERIEKAGVMTTEQWAERAAVKKEVETLSNKFNSLGKREIENIKAEDLEKVLQHAKEGVIKKVEESDKFSEAEKAGLREKHTEEVILKEQVVEQRKQETTGQQSAEKSQEIIDELRNIRQELEHNAGISSRNMPALTHATTPNNRISRNELKVIETQLNSEIRVANNRRINTTDETERTKQEHALDQLNQARKHVKDLAQHIKNMPGQEFRVA